MMDQVSCLLFVLLFNNIKNIVHVKSYIIWNFFFLTNTGREGAEKFATKLGHNRCLLVRPTSSTDPSTSSAITSQSPKDANEALLMGTNMRALIEGANPLPHKEILTFNEVRKLN